MGSQFLVFDASGGRGFVYGSKTPDMRVLEVESVIGAWVLTTWYVCVSDAKGHRPGKHLKRVWLPLRNFERPMYVAEVNVYREIPRRPQ